MTNSKAISSPFFCFVFGSFFSVCWLSSLYRSWECWLLFLREPSRPRYCHNWEEERTRPTLPSTGPQEVLLPRLERPYMGRTGRRRTWGRQGDGEVTEVTESRGSAPIHRLTAVTPPTLNITCILTEKRALTRRSKQRDWTGHSDITFTIDRAGLMQGITGV